jgi:hypothetical protein
MLPRRTTDTDGDNLAMAVDDGSYHQHTSVSDTTVNLRWMWSMSGKSTPRSLHMATQGH